MKGKQVKIERQTMNLLIEKYHEQEARWPREGKYIMAQFDADSIVVYQAFQPGICRYAVGRGQFGGSKFSFNRMSWIKPNFLWMMYRCGWASKEHQEGVLAIRIRRDGFDEILRQAVPSTYPATIYENEAAWQESLKKSFVRLQWDPDHDPFGEKLLRRAIQLGLRGEILHSYCGLWIVSIEDITDFVHAQHNALKTQGLDALMTPKEDIYPVNDLLARKQLGISDEQTTG
jgi:hypothetical protein